MEQKYVDERINLSNRTMQHEMQVAQMHKTFLEQSNFQKNTQEMLLQQQQQHQEAMQLLRETMTSMRMEIQTLHKQREREEQVMEAKHLENPKGHVSPIWLSEIRSHDSLEASSTSGTSIGQHQTGIGHFKSPVKSPIHHRMQSPFENFSSRCTR